MRSARYQRTPRLSAGDPHEDHRRLRWPRGDSPLEDPAQRRRDDGGEPCQSGHEPCLSTSRLTSPHKVNGWQRLPM
eukprot:387078-Hanusia_phi.AAC.1